MDRQQAEQKAAKALKRAVQALEQVTAFHVSFIISYDVYKMVIDAHELSQTALTNLLDDIG